VAALSGLALCFHARDPIQGFLAFNEGFYLTNGAMDVGRSSLAPVLAPLDANNPFVYPLVLVTALRAFGISTLAARAVSIAASVLSVLLTFALGRRLYDERVGLVAALVFAFTPGQVLVGRNIQIDALMLTFMLAASLAFVWASETQSKRWSIAAGVLLGVGVLTKLPVALLVPGFALWESWRSQGIAWVRRTSTWLVAASGVITAAPWYVYRYVASSEFRGAQSTLAGVGAWRGLRYFWHYVVGQIVWMFSPVLIVVVIASLVLLARRREDSDKFILAVLGVLLGVFVFYNYHSYYFLPLVPFSALAAARGIDAAARRLSRGSTGKWGRQDLVMSALTSLLVVILLAFSAATLCAKKLEAAPTDQYVPLLAAKGYDPHALLLGIGNQRYGLEGPAIRFYAEQAGARVVVYPSAESSAPPAGFRLVVLASQSEGRPNGGQFVGYPAVKVVAPVVFGRALVFSGRRTSFFDLERPSIRVVGAWWRFGFQSFKAEDPEYGLFLVR